MKILWFTNTPGRASEKFGYKHAGAGWITSLQSILIRNTDCILGICFFYDGFEYKKVTIENVTYFGIPLKKGNMLTRFLDRQRQTLNDQESISVNNIVKEFKPDIIQIFGTELGYGKILHETHQNTVVHLQGLINPTAESYFPKGLSKIKTVLNDSVSDTIRGVSTYHLHKWFTKRMIREQEIVKKWRYFLGRTDWDRNYIEMLNPTAAYFHCDEILRPAFYENNWHNKDLNQKGKPLTLSTTINPNMYKGLDLVYKTLPLLKNIPIKWNLIGIKEDSQLNKTIKKILKIDKTPNELVFHGPLRENELIEALKESDLFIHPSYIDNSPNSVCEAMLLGMPVISSSVGGVPSLLTHKKTGILFNPYDRYDLAGWIHHLSRNPEKGIEYGINARNTALERHDPDMILKTLLKIYEQVLAENPDGANGGQ